MERRGRGRGAWSIAASTPGSGLVKARSRPRTPLRVDSTASERRSRAPGSRRGREKRRASQIGPRCSPRDWPAGLDAAHHLQERREVRDGRHLVPVPPREQPPAHGLELLQHRVVRGLLRLAVAVARHARQRPPRVLPHHRHDAAGLRAQDAGEAPGLEHRGLRVLRRHRE